MPSSLPRISLVLSQEQHRLLKRLGQLTGRSQASIVMDCLKGFLPSLTAQMALLEAYNELEQVNEPELALEAVEAAVHSLDLASVVQLGQLEDVRAKIDRALSDMRASLTPGSRGVGGVAGGVSASPLA